MKEEEWLDKFEVKEHNIRILLNLVLNIMTNEQLEELKRQIGELEKESREKSQK